MVSVGLALIGVGVAVIGALTLWGLYRRLRRRYKRLRRQVDAHGPTVLASRRNAIRVGGGAILLGVGLRYGVEDGELAIPDGVPNATRVESEVRALANPTPSGTRRFDLGAGGYQYAEWTADGRLEIGFYDDPPMQEWYLVGPKPERELLASGTPPTFGGTRTVGLAYPIQPGQYLLTGAKVVANPDTFMGMEAERTGTARFSVEPDVWLAAVESAGENGMQAALTVRNVGSCPVRLEGVKFGEAVPGSGTRQFIGFVDGPRRLIPGDAVTVVSEMWPFQNGEEVRVPESFEVGLWAAEQPFWFEYDGGEVRRVEGTPTPG